VAAGLCRLCSCRSHLPGEEVEGAGVGSGERLKHRRMPGASGPDGQGAHGMSRSQLLRLGATVHRLGHAPLPLLG